MHIRFLRDPSISKNMHERENMQECANPRDFTDYVFE